MLGRKDNQVKINGFRIELNEINNVLAKFEGIKECTTIVLENKKKKVICSYLASENGLPINENTIRDYLKQSLPYYMIPTYFIQMESLPLTANGKIDKKALPSPMQRNNTEITLPKNIIEEKLLNIFKSTLNLEKVSTTDSFFELGGDSLLAIRLIIQIKEKLNIKIKVQNLFENSTISELAKFISSSRNHSNSLDKIMKAEAKDFYHLSSAQKRIYYSSKIAGEETILYNTPGAIIFNKKPDMQKLNECFKKLIKRHSSLRTYFEEIDEEIYQRIAPSIAFEVEELEDKNRSIDEIIKDFVKPFNLGKAPLFHVCFVDNADKYLLLLDMHHIICDGASLSIFTKELSDLYNQKSIPDLSFDYVDYAEWEFENLKNGKFNENKDYWVNQFKDNIPVLDFPTDYVRPSVQSFEGAKIYKNIDKALADKILGLSKELNVSPYMLLLAAYYVLLYKYSNSEDIVVGSPIANRNIPEISNMLGMFVNTLPLKCHIENGVSFKDFLNTVKSNCIAALDNEIYPFDKLVNDLKITRDTSKSPLFDTMFIYQNEGQFNINFDGINSSVYVPDANISKFDLSLEIIPNVNGELDLNFEYCTKLFKKDTIQRFADHYISVIEKIIDNSNTNIENIDILSEEEKHKILYEFNNTKREYPREKTIIELFEEQVQKTPDSVAVVFEDKKLTYRELNEKANNLAMNLLTNKTEINDTVSILLDRSLEMIISIFACIKSGMPYVLIEKTLPFERIKYILENSNSKLLITNSKLYSNEFDISTILLDNFNFETSTRININHSKDTENICIIYTSGSTGNPKGVLLRQKGIINLVFAMDDAMNLKICEKFISHASVSFDMFAFELYCALLNGKTLYLTNDIEQKDSVAISDIIINNDIDFLLSTPSKIELLLSDDKLAESLAKIKVFLLGGEVFTSNLYNRMKSKTNGNIYNGYGPTEITACCSIKKIENEHIINIGTPVNNTQIYILDKDLSLCPIGVIGELCVAGDGLAAGYINNKERTDKSFVNVKSINTNVYRTGDLAKFNSNGELEYIGRSDFQVKLHGQRIELEEIERNIANINAINNTCVCIQKIQDREILCAYYTTNTPIDKKEISTILAKKLPSYMVPTYFIELEELPLTMNGKIDRKKLPTDFALDIDTDIVLPTNETENILLNIYKNILHIQNIGIKHNFFEIGGDSITALKVSIECKKQNLNISYSDIFKFPTVEELAKNTKNLDVDLNVIKNCDYRDYYATSSAQKRIYLASKMDENSTLYNIYGGILLDNMPNINKLQSAIDTIISRHEVLRTYFEIENNQIVQKIAKDIDIKVEIQDVNTNNANDLFYIYITNFDLSKAPLFKATLFKLPNGKSLLMLDVHHIIFDGISLNNFMSELSKVYNEEILPMLDVSYKDFAIWENEALKNDTFKESKKYWLDKFSGNVPVLNMPTVYERPKRKSYEGKTYRSLLSKDFTKKINDFASKYNVTPFMVMLSSYYILLSKYSGDTDIIVGTPTSGRLYKELEPLLGMFVNSVPLRNTILPNMSFEEFLQNIKNTCLDSFEHQDYPFDILVNDLKLKKDPSRNLLFDTMFTYQNVGIELPRFSGLNAEYIPPIEVTSKFDISLEVLPEDGKLTLFFEYCNKLFDEIFIGNFTKSYENILCTILDNPKILIKDITVIENTVNNLSVFNKIELENKQDLGLLESKITSNIFSDFTNKNSYDTISLSYNNNIEKQVADVFKKLLPVSDIGPNDNFFDLGGDSLGAINLQIELLKLNYKLTYADIFECPTIKELANKISANIL